MKIFLKQLTGDFIELEINEKTTEKEALEILHQHNPTDFPKHYTRLVRLIDDVNDVDTFHQPFQPNEMAMILVDFTTYYVSFPMICSIPKTLETCLFKNIPKRLVKILQRDIPDLRRSTTIFMQVEWTNREGRVERGYIEQP